MHPETAYIAGVIIGASSDWDRGIALVRDVVRVNPFGPNPRRTWLAMDALTRDDAPTALAEASLVHFPGYVHGHVIRAICFDRMGLDELAGAEMQRVLELDPAFLDHAEKVLGAVPTVPAHVVDHLVDSLPR
jgi:hypothetical protein